MNITPMGCSWNVYELSLQLPQHLIAKIKAIPVSYNPYPFPNKQIWNLTKNAIFSTKYAYSFILSLDKNICFHPAPSLDPNFKWIWKNLSHSRETLFTWKAYRKVLPVNLKLFKKNCSSSPLCPICKTDPETHLHILRDYPLIKQTWLLLYPLPLPFSSLILSYGYLKTLKTILGNTQIYLGRLFSLMLLDPSGSHETIIPLRMQFFNHL